MVVRRAGRCSETEATMSYVTFYNDEEGFDEWVKSHSFGIVINSSPSRLNPDYIKAHRPQCNSFQKHTSAKTVYSKHCFDGATEAIEYLKSKDIPKPSFGCSTCKVSALESTSDAQQLEQSVTELLANGFTSAPLGNRNPLRVAALSTTLVQRDPAVVAWILKATNGKCELCTADAPFQTSIGRPYLEVHHVRTLASGGPDTIDNTVALCPNCHRSMHYSKFKGVLNEQIYIRISRLVR